MVAGLLGAIAVLALVVWIFRAAGTAMRVIFALAASLTIGPVLRPRNRRLSAGGDEHLTPKEAEQSLFDARLAMREPFARQVQQEL